MRPAEAAAVVVVGSLNMDIVVPVPRHPRPGETIIGSDSFRTPGGKGANQAVAAARLGQRVAMVGRVGGDDAGAKLVAALNDYGVDYAHVSTTPEAPTGIALITVDPDGENIIVVSSGANARVEPADVEAAAGALERAAVVALQLEIPIAAVVAAATVTDTDGNTIDTSEFFPDRGKADEGAEDSDDADDEAGDSADEHSEE